MRWIHAGEERPTEFHLQQAIDKRPRLREATTITGYVAEADLDAYIAAADLVINLRFPSVGESSGTLARALSAGRCCIVNDTATYAEIPRDAVVHIPILGTVPALVRAMEALLGDGDLRAMFGERARSYACDAHWHWRAWRSNTRTSLIRSTPLRAGGLPARPGDRPIIRVRRVHQP